MRLACTLDAMVGITSASIVRVGEWSSLTIDYMLYDCYGWQRLPCFAHGKWLSDDMSVHELRTNARSEKEEHGVFPNGVWYLTFRFYVYIFMGIYYTGYGHHGIYGSGWAGHEIAAFLFSGREIYLLRERCERTTLWEDGKTSFPGHTTQTLYNIDLYGSELDWEMEKERKGSRLFLFSGASVCCCFMGLLLTFDV